MLCALSIMHKLSFGTYLTAVLAAKKCQECSSIAPIKNLIHSNRDIERYWIFSHSLLSVFAFHKDTYLLSISNKKTLRLAKKNLGYLFMFDLTLLLRIKVKCHAVLKILHNLKYAQIDTDIITLKCLTFYRPSSPLFSTYLHIYFVLFSSSS